MEDVIGTHNSWKTVLRVTYFFTFIGITTFRNALRAHYLPHSSGKIGGHDQISNKDAIILYCLANGVKVDYAKLIWEDIIHKLNKKTREYLRFISLILEYIMPEYDNEELTIHPTQMCLWTSKLQKLPHKLRRLPKKKSLELKVDSEENNLENTYLSPRLRHLNPKLANQMAKDKSSSHPSPSTPGCDASTDSTAEVDPGKSAPNDSIPSQQGMDEGTKNYSIDHIFAGTNPSVLVDKTKYARDGLKTAHTDLDESEEVETKKDEDTHATSHDVPKDTSVPHPPSLKSAQIQELMAQELKRHVQGMEIELPVDLNDILIKLETFTSIVSRLMSQSVQAKLQTLDTLPSLLNKVANTLTRFASIMENASYTATSKGIPSAGLVNASPAEGEKNTNHATKDAKTTNLHNELVDLLGIDIVTQYYNKKLLYDKYYNNMLKRRKSSKIINCDVLTQKGPITLQVYRKDGKSFQTSKSVSCIWLNGKR
ncbi:hypothetical protein Tco_1363972 [Tanacetum coccineum]